MKPPFMQIAAAAMAAALAAFPTHGADVPWESALRQAYFGDRPIADGDGVIRLEAPQRAENPAIVPVQVEVEIPQTPQRYVRRITVLIDNNPDPLAGVFELSPRSGRADLGLRLRVNAYSPVRAIAETNDGALYMAERFVKASGGCSAPVGTDLETARARLGKMRIKTVGQAAPGEPQLIQLMVSHPNITGLQLDQLTLLPIPAEFVRDVAVTFEGEPVLTAQVGITLSENPSLRFYLLPEAPGTLRATVTDSEGRRFSGELELRGEASAAWEN